MENDVNMCRVNRTGYKLVELVSLKQLKGIIEEIVKSHEFSIEKWMMYKASEGLAGYLGEHLRLSITVSTEKGIEEIKLFMKCIPKHNEPKVQFLKNCLFYKREEFVVNELLKDAGGFEESNQWRPKVYTCNEEIIVMPDMADFGYVMRDKYLYFDVEHCLLTLTALAKYHAASVNYEINQSMQRGTEYRIIDEYSDLLEELNFRDSPWMTSGARTISNFLGVFSKKYNSSSIIYNNLQKKLEKHFLQACDSIKFKEDAVNVVIHKDLWSNNVMFKYEGGKPVNAIILDFQCVRYASPAFDVSTFMYLNTSRNFRQTHERGLLQHYYKNFCKSLTLESAKKLEKYTFETFLEVFETSRMFGLLVPVMIFPYIIMDPMSGKKYFDDPLTYERYNNEDRTGPVVEYARTSAVYKDKILEVSEEFVELFTV